MPSGLMDSAGPQPFVTEPGRYEMSDAVYHADPVVGGSLSSTGARLILISPAKFAYRRAAGSEERRVFDVGRAAHTLVLGAGAEIVCVEGGGADMNAWRTNDDKARVAAVRAEGKTPLTPNDYAMVSDMADALRANVEVSKFLEEGLAEESFFAPDPETGTWRRGRADYRHGSNQVIDYKTCQNANPVDFAASMGKWGYHQQGAFYVDILGTLGEVDEDCEFLIIAQEKEPPYLCSVVRPDEEAIAYGRKLNEKALRLFAECSATGTWPGYPTEPVTVSLPGWLVAQYEADGLGEVELAQLDPLSVAILAAGSLDALKAVWRQNRASWTVDHQRLAESVREKVAG